MKNILYTLANNLGNPELQALHDKLSANYRVKARFDYKGYNGEKIICSGRVIVYRPDKFKAVTYKGVTLIEGNLKSGGGSNRYPSVAHKGAYCVLEFTSIGFPYVPSDNGWTIEILELEKL